MSSRRPFALALALLAPLGPARGDEARDGSRARISYALGVEAGNGFRSRAIDLEPEAFSKGLADALSGRPRLTDEQVRAAIAELQAQVKHRELELRKAAAQESRTSAQKFLAENERREGVVTLPSGLQYRVLERGQGRTPMDADTVRCSYRGSLVNGMEFDSSDRGGSSSRFRVEEAIAGVREALKLMPVGSRWQVFVPMSLASGPRQATTLIPPNQTLVFELTLREIE